MAKKKIINYYVIEKRVKASSVKEAIKKEKEADIINVILQQENLSENPLGFSGK